jgi:type II secretory pathway predicted ATPase ExeA
MSTELNQHFGLKWNPFRTDVPHEGLFLSPEARNFVTSVAKLTKEGGYAHISGAPGSGKSTICRYLNRHLSSIEGKVRVHSISRPQSTLPDFYRELAVAFDLEIGFSSKYRSFNALRESCQKAIAQVQHRPVLIIDEVQLVKYAVLEEIRLLTMEKFDSRRLLTVIFSGDHRFTDMLNTEELLPLQSRIQARLKLNPKTPFELKTMVEDLLSKAGNRPIIDIDVLETLVSRCASNPRVLMRMLNSLLEAAFEAKAFTINQATMLKTIGENP